MHLIESTNGTSEEKPFRIFVDTTGVTHHDRESPTGIPRVQHFLIEAAAADASSEICFVVFDRVRQHYRELSSSEIAALVNGGATVGLFNVSGMKRRRVLSLLLDAFGAFGATDEIGKEYERRYAAMIGGQNQRGLLYSVIKVTLRIYRWALSPIFKFNPFSSRVNTSVDLKQGVLFLSNASVFGPQFPQSFMAAPNRAFILHDMIPVTHPQFATNRRAASRFVRNLDAALAAGCKVLCTSLASQQVLQRYIENIPDARCLLRRFALPSFLYERTLQGWPENLIEPAEPFVLFCSTIEPRKNHLLLLRIWRRALAEGIELPRLVCVGKWGWSLDDVRDFLHENSNFLGKVRFMGQVPDAMLAGLYRTARFGVMPSQVEGWGLGASECLDFGTPVIVSKAPALLEATRGLMPAIDCDDFDGWYREICRLSFDDEAIASLKRTIADNYCRISTHASWTSLKSVLLDL